MSSNLLSILESTRVSAPTRRALDQRLTKPAIEYTPQAVSPAAFATLEALLARLLPVADPALRLAARLDNERATGPGNGWRYGNQPVDSAALGAGLRCLDDSAVHQHQRMFLQLTPREQDALLSKVQSGDVKWDDLDAGRWFEEVLADAVELYVSHPIGMAAMSFDGFADDPAGWPSDAIGLNNTQPWEPAPGKVASTPAGPEGSEGSTR